MTDAEKSKATIKGTIVKGGGSNSQGFIDSMKERFEAPDSHGLAGKFHHEDCGDHVEFWVVR